MKTNTYAACLNDQGKFAATCVGDFTLLDSLGRHTWKGLTASTPEELAEQVNGALASIAAFGDPYKTLEVVSLRELEKVRQQTAIEEASRIEELESELTALREVNRELREMLNKKPKLEVLKAVA